ncbi:tetratricopeptide repeat protein [Halocola ammonii]
MSEEERNRQEESEIFFLVKRYEEMIANNESYYFDVDQFENLIDYYFDRNNLKEAGKVLLYAHDLFPDSTALLLREAQLLSAEGKLTRALNKLRKLLAFEPFNEDLHVTMATIYSQLRDHKRAIEHYERVLQFGDSEMANDIYIDLAMEHENNNDFNSAIAVLKEALEKNPENETATYELAYCYERTDQSAEGIQYYQRFLDDHPYSFTAWYNLGNAFQKLELYEKSIDAYDFSLAIDDSFSPANFNKANALIKLDKYREAIECFEEVIAVEGESPTTFCMIGECHENMLQYEWAEHFYKRALEKDSSFPDAFIGLGVIRDLKGNTQQALPYFEQALKADPTNVDFMLITATALKKCNRIDAAENLYLEILKIDKQCEDAWLDYSELLANEDRLESALEVLENGIKEMSDQSLVLKFRKVAYLHQNLHQKEAFELLEALLEKESEKIAELTSFYPEIEKEKSFGNLMNLYKKNK